jgi:hypothetical protein
MLSPAESSSIVELPFWGMKPYLGVWEFCWFESNCVENVACDHQEDNGCRYQDKHSLQSEIHFIECSHCQISTCN